MQKGIARNAGQQHTLLVATFTVNWSPFAWQPSNRQFQQIYQLQAGKVMVEQCPEENSWHYSIYAPAADGKVWLPRWLVNGSNIVNPEKIRVF